MKRIIFAAMAVMVFGFANAQKTRFGVKGGLNVTSFAGGYNYNAKSLVGFQVGGFAEIKVIERLAIQPEILFSTQGAKQELSMTNFDSKLNYINVPVLAKFYITKQFTVEAGPQLGFLVSAKQDGHDAKDSYKSVDTGFNFGAGYNFTDNVSVNLRYTVGLSNIGDYSTNTIQQYYDSPKNSVLALTLGYKF
ncbi:outer membrane protein with beta-barrel domain [Flavobacterium sp. 90]|uniref:porin family protein n=1 Tax=unclassified Flavobacterium TaxID=196869 RepID=UPI000EB1D16D|nr:MULTISPECIES: porin family protein [unclassified Flavobacterium]RKR11157.1 outer membrane protein with beta-barrel domain [Flavobacterium sp. 81]TCK54938.1 outer membrane protein with beta-barrel domain [Flavobacterium sp. 90]